MFGTRRMMFVFRFALVSQSLRRVRAVFVVWLSWDPFVPKSFFHRDVPETRRIYTVFVCVPYATYKLPVTEKKKGGEITLKKNRVNHIWNRDKTWYYCLKINSISAVFSIMSRGVTAAEEAYRRRDCDDGSRWVDRVLLKRPNIVQYPWCVTVRGYNISVCRRLFYRFSSRMHDDVRICCNYTFSFVPHQTTCFWRLRIFHVTGWSEAV